MFDQSAMFHRPTTSALVSSTSPTWCHCSRVSHPPSTAKASSYPHTGLLHTSPGMNTSFKQVFWLILAYRSCCYDYFLFFLFFISRDSFTCLYTLQYIFESYGLYISPLVWQQWWILLYRYLCYTKYSMLVSSSVIHIVKFAFSIQACWCLPVSSI